MPEFPETSDRSVDRHRIRSFVRLIGILRQLYVNLFLIGRYKDEAHVWVTSQGFVSTNGGDHRR